MLGQRIFLAMTAPTMNGMLSARIRGTDVALNLDGEVAVSEAEAGAGAGFFSFFLTAVPMPFLAHASLFADAFSCANDFDFCEIRGMI